MAPSFVLAVMGVTGAGKSSFIKLATGDDRIKIGHSHKSETKQIGTHDVQIRGSKFTLIDTPGFDDDNLSDSDILKLLVDWLASTYRSGRKLNGILYLHRITDARMRGSSLRNFKVLKELIGEDFHANVTLGTTCWSLVPSEIAIARENELSTSTGFWKTLISKGARLERIPETATEARELIYQIASHDPIVLQTQRDIVDLGKSFSSLTVAKLVDTEFEELRKQHEAEVERRRKEAAAESARQELNRQEELRQIRERDARILREKDERISSYKTRQANCRRIHPIGNCDKCRVNALSRFTVTYHCCSCRDHDMYWHCAACGNNCGEAEHPLMSRIDNPESGCIVM